MQLLRLITYNLLSGSCLVHERGMGFALQTHKPILLIEPGHHRIELLVREYYHYELFISELVSNSKYLSKPKRVSEIANYLRHDPLLRSWHRHWLSRLFSHWISPKWYR